MSGKANSQRASPKWERKTIEFELENYNEAEGIFSGYGAVFSNIDSGGDIIEPGAFTKTIAENAERVKILSGHNEGLLPIGKPLELREDAKGLFLKAKISDTALGRDVKTLIGDGVLCELSIGYDPVTFEYDSDGIRHLKEVKLWEISVVTWAMNEEAVIIDFKASDLSAQFEAQLKAELEQDMAEIKAGRKISAARMRTIKDASATMKTAVKLLDAIIREAEDGGKKAAQAQAVKKALPRGQPTGQTKQTVEILF